MAVTSPTLSAQRPEAGPVSRIYAVESTPSLLGAAADHHLRWLHTPLSRSRQPWEVNRETHNGRRQVAYRPVGWSLRQLVDDTAAGRFSLLVVMGGNPAFTAPADIPFAQSMLNVATRVHLGLFDDETAAECQWHIPAVHPLEGWSDARV